jgi:signal transduction histidine kinase
VKGFIKVCVTVVVNTEGKNSVLVVDDNPIIRGVIQNILLQENFEVVVAPNGNAAFDLIQQKICDVILCDVMMPEMDGYQFFQTVRSHQIYGIVPFIFLTALDSEPEMARGWRTGCDAYLTKPFDAQLLVSTIKGKVSRSQELKKTLESQRDSFRKRVLNTVSHEFRTPLVAISTGSEMLLGKMESGKSDLMPGDDHEVEKAKKLIEAIYRGGQRLERLVSDFMLLQQIEIGVAESFQARNARPHSLASIINSAVESSKDFAKQNSVALIVEGAIPDLKINVCDVQLVESLVRVIDNGIKFSMSPNAVKIVMDADTREVRISVLDSGPGFDPAKLRQSIGAFSQLDRDINEQQGGGLGLAIASKLAALNGGFLSFDSRPDCGGVVTVHLPVCHCPNK